MFKRQDLFTHGFHLQKFSLHPQIQILVEQEKWNELDQFFIQLTSPEGELYSFIQNFHSFSKIETMLSIRESSNPDEEDGIWHDDGSRVFAFSLSLNFHPDQIEGGELELRVKNEESSEMIFTPEYGTAILFLTGIHGYEHRTRRVKKGRRIMLVGWCSD